MESEFWYDSPETPKCKMEPWCAKISPGLNDSVGKYSRSQITWNTRNAINELRGALEICTLEHSHKLFHDHGHRSIEEVMTSAANSFSGSCSLSHFELDTTSNDMETKHVKYTASKLLTNSGKTKSLHTPLDVEPCLQVTTSTENSVRYFIYMCVTNKWSCYANISVSTSKEINNDLSAAKLSDWLLHCI